jgi:hypothetical protein
LKAGIVGVSVLLTTITNLERDVVQCFDREGLPNLTAAVSYFVLRGMTFSR